MENLDNWCKQENAFLYVHVFYMWNIWLSHNFCNFENRSLVIGTTCHSILDQVISFPEDRSKKKVRKVGLAPTISYPVGFFDGAAASKIGGASITLSLNLSHVFHIKLGCGASTNTRA